jgi:hypothetical protein
MQEGTQPNKGENGGFQRGWHGFHILGVFILGLTALGFLWISSSGKIDSGGLLKLAQAFFKIR